MAEGRSPTLVMNYTLVGKLIEISAFSEGFDPNTPKGHWVHRGIGNNDED